MADRAKRPPGEALVDLRRRLSLLPPRDPGRTEIIARASEAYGISILTLYRALRELNRPRSVRRSDHGATRVAPQAEMERYADIVAALKIRTTNKKGRHVSTVRAIEFLETDGVETPDGLVKVAPGLLKRATIDRLLRSSGLDYTRVTRPHAAVRFQARRSNELWHFDMSPSDLKQVEAPLWIEQGRGKPTLILFSAVDDCSGVVYQGYRSVYGEDAESALRFLFNAFAAKPEPELPLQGLPVTIYMDDGPVSRSRVFQSVMGSLGIRVLIPGSATTCAVRRWRRSAIAPRRSTMRALGPSDAIIWPGCSAPARPRVKVADLMEEDAIDLIVERLRTPLQIEMHLTLAFEQGFRLAAKPVTVELVEQVLSRAINDLEPTLTRNGYDPGALAGQFNARPSDGRAFLAGTLDAEHTRELTEQLREAGVPI